MLRWYFNGRVPVIQINERGRFMGFRDPGMNAIAGHAGLYVAREPDNCNPRVDVDDGGQRSRSSGSSAVWRGIVMDTYALEKLTGWTPELSPPPDSPLFRWRVLAECARAGARCARADESAAACEIARPISADCRRLAAR